MKHVLFIFLLFFVIFKSQAQTSLPTYAWLNYDSSQCKDMCFDDHYLYSVGNALVKRDTFGNIVWQKPEFAGHKLVVDNQHNILVISTLSPNGATFGTTTLNSNGGTDILVLKIDSAGNLIWANNYGNAVNNSANEICVDYNNDFYLNGTFDNTLANSFVNKYTSSGSLVWTKTLVDSNVSNSERHIAYSAVDSSIVVSGLFKISLTVDGQNIVTTPSASFQHSNDVYVLKLRNSDGSRVYLKDISQTVRADYANNSMYVNPVNGQIILNYNTLSLFADFINVIRYDKNANFLQQVDYANLLSSDYFQFISASNNRISYFVSAQTPNFLRLKDQQNNVLVNYEMYPRNKVVFGGNSLYIPIWYMDPLISITSYQFGIAKIGNNCQMNQSFSSQNLSLCAGQLPYTFNNQALTQSGTYYDTVQNAAGCDSFITLNLTVLNSSQTTLTETACNSFSFNNQTLTQSGTYYDTVQNAAGCDSFITLNLTVLNSSQITLTETACDSFNFNSLTLAQSGTYYDTLQNAAGCDSFITLNLTILNSSQITLTETACDSFNFNSLTLAQSGTYYDTLQNVAGCDSFITLNLTILNSSQTVLNDTACGSYVYGNVTLTQSGTYYDTLQNVAGCDSIITLQLVIVNPNVGVTLSGAQLIASAANASYQWVSCPSYTPIPNANSQTFNIIANGSYAVVVTENGCVDTSICYLVTIFDLAQHNQFKFQVSPNPNNGVVEISSNLEIKNAAIKISSLNGELVLRQDIKIPKGSIRVDLSALANGVYILEIQDGSRIGRTKIVKE